MPEAITHDERERRVTAHRDGLIQRVGRQSVRAVPKGMPRPYIVIEDRTWDNGSTKDAFEEDYILKVGIYTDYGGTLENCAILNVVEEIISAAYNAGALQFAQTPTRSAFCVTMFWFGVGETRVLRPDEILYEEELERTMLDLMFRVKQLR